VYPLCDWCLPEPDPSEYPDNGQGRDNLAADCAYFAMEKKLHSCVLHIMESFKALRGGHRSL
jgi:hypothetical protein